VFRGHPPLFPAGAGAAALSVGNAPDHHKKCLFVFKQKQPGPVFVKVKAIWMRVSPQEHKSQTFNTNIKELLLLKLFSAQINIVI
jgi:hypothetical protein